MSSVSWDALSPDTFEDMCAVLVSRLHPESRRIDGSGGDGGIDVQVATPHGPVIYEMKSFTGRMTSTRRQQVVKSLKRASKHNPSTWVLIVPIDPTPAEESWFQTITNSYQFQCEWRGLTWLDGKAAEYPDIVRYYISNSSDEIVEVLRELSKESGALARGVPDAVDRMKVLSRRLNGLDPHYSFGISIDKEGAVAVSAWPKYVGAERDRPIRIDALFRFPDTDRGRAAAEALQESFDFGTPVVIPAEFIGRFAVDAPAGLGQASSIGELKLGIPDLASFPNFSVQLRILDENGRTRAQLPLVGQTTNIGRRGGDAKMQDVTGAIKAQIRMNLETQSLSVRFRYEIPECVLPGAMVPALQFLSEYHPPNSMVLLIDDKEGAAPTPITTTFSEWLSHLLSVAKALDEIQRITGVYFIFPKTLSSDEVQSVFTARKLLAGEVVKSHWSTFSVTSTVNALESLQASVRRGPNQLMHEAELKLHIGGQDIPLGYTRQVLPSAVVADWPSVPDNAGPDTPVVITFQPGADNSATMSLLTNSDKRPTNGPK